MLQFVPQPDPRFDFYSTSQYESHLQPLVILLLNHLPMQELTLQKDEYLLSFLLQLTVDGSIFQPS